LTGRPMLTASGKPGFTLLVSPIKQNIIGTSNIRPDDRVIIPRAERNPRSCPFGKARGNKLAPALLV
jgi:hypothetical protein